MRSVECRLRNGGGTFDPRGVFTSSTPARYIPHSALRIPHSGVVMGFPHKPHPKETVLLSKHFGEVDARTYKGWVKRGGYEVLRQALTMEPAKVTDVVKESGLRGRGGAGFPTGLKWSFMPKEKKKPHYLCVNADESEPGTFKDREIMRWTPHALLEGAAIAAHAIQAEVVYIYIRGEFTEPWAVMEQALAEATVASVCGHVQQPGNYEVTMGFPLKDLLYDLCGGMPPGRTLKACIPGGSSVPILNREETEGCLLDYEGVVEKGSMLGSGGVIVFDDSTDMVYQIMRLARFYAHESCAQCTQCREGTAWTTKILERILAGQGKTADLDLLLDLADNMTGKTICVLSDSCAAPVVSGIKKFKKEFEDYIAGRRKPVMVA